VRRYDDPVEVRKGMVADLVGPDADPVEGPEQFLWHGRLWKVRDVLAHWVETGAWWQSGGVRAVLGSDDGSTEAGAVARGDLLTEREVWRVEAGVGPAISGNPSGVFDLSFDWADGNWQLVACHD